ncbi:MAG TPA: nuclear transport factor 2 family protein [Gemmatimonadales bacterium]|nr:nuclear transport factor 2 family protein [Gemmatimonadales bacterium]
MRRAAAGVCLTAFAVLGGCKPAAAPITAADRAAAQTMDSTYSAAIAAGDVNGMTAIYTQDAMMQPPMMPAVHGMEALRQFYQAMSSAKVNITLTQETADGAGDFMYTTGRYHYQQMPAETGPSEDGKYLEIFRRGADGKWMVVAESWSPNAPRAPMPAAPAAPAPRRAK